MKYVIYGAGGIGATVGAALFLAGESVTLIARGEHLARLRSDGLKLTTPDGSQTLPIPAVKLPSDLQWDGDEVVVMAMKGQHTEGALNDLDGVAPSSIALLAAQNGVANERAMIRRFEHVYGVEVLMPATHLTPGEVVAHQVPVYGVLDLGCYPEGIDSRASAIAESLTRAGVASTPRADIMNWKYRKLLANLGNAVQALTDTAPEVRQIMSYLRGEAFAVFAAAGIVPIPTAEYKARNVVTRNNRHSNNDRGGGSTWQSFVRGTGDAETDYLNGEIVVTGKLAGVPTPVNALVRRLAVYHAKAKSGVGIVPGPELLEQVQAIHVHPPEGANKP